MNAVDVLWPAFRKVQIERNVRPFLEEILSAGDVWYASIPERVVDFIAKSSNFTLSERADLPAGPDLAGELWTMMFLIVTRPIVDGELWVLAGTIVTQKRASLCGCSFSEVSDGGRACNLSIVIALRIRAAGANDDRIPV